jgi:hypothetical protein
VELKAASHMRIRSPASAAHDRPENVACAPGPQRIPLRDRGTNYPRGPEPSRCPDRERSDRRPLIRLLFFRVLILGEYMGGDVWAALEQQGDNLCLPVTLVGLHIKASHTGSASIAPHALARAEPAPRKCDPLQASMPITYLHTYIRSVG